MNYKTIKINTSGEGFYQITPQIQAELKEYLRTFFPGKKSGIAVLFSTHTSCSLTISESFDPSASVDMENFLKHLAKRDLPFITHDSEGDDDSPSHMKSILMSTSLSLIVEDENVVLGTWQGIYLTEFRDSPKNRTLFLKFIPD